MRDVASATYQIALKGHGGESYHISTWQTVSIRQLVEQICDLTGVPFDDFVEITKDRLGKDQAYQLDSSKLRDELGWQDEIPLDKGLQETLRWMDDNIEILKHQPDSYQHKK
jgi:dTDP-glucose 4,6-dehydratase